jgi:hypothetical protein
MGEGHKRDFVGEHPVEILELADPLIIIRR